MGNINILFLIIPLFCQAHETAHKKCNISADLGFVIDKSLSSKNDLPLFEQNIKSFLKDAVKNYNFGEDGIKAGVITFGTFSNVDVYFDDCNNQSCFDNSVNQIKYSTKESQTRIDLALQQAKRELFQRSRGYRGGGPKYPSYIVLISDGGQNPWDNPRSENKEMAMKAASDLKAMGVTLLVFGTASNQKDWNLHQHLLINISSPKHYWKVNGVQDLKNNLEKVFNVIKCTPCMTPSLNIMVNEASCKKRCGKDHRIHTETICHCDKYCEALQDCCPDFSKWCRMKSSEKSLAEPKMRCWSYLRKNDSCKESKYYTGVIQVISCPVNYKDRQIQQRCIEDDTADFLRSLPVYNFYDSMTYKNIFCATCNNVTNSSFWDVQPADCPGGFYNYCLNQTKEKWLECFTTYCVFNYFPPPGAKIKKCVTKNAFQYFDVKSLYFNLKEMCSRCDRKDSIECDFCKYNYPMSSFLNIFFRFFWTGYSAGSPKLQLLRVTRKCGSSYVYNPVLKICQRVLPKIHKNISHCKQNDDILEHDGFLLINSSSNYTEVLVIEKIASEGILCKLSPVCRGLSIAALLFLLFIYGIFSQLRNIPGLNLMNLASALILYQAFLFAAGSSETREVCVFIAAGLHFFILVSFAWMGVMGFDVSKAFTASGKRVYGRHCLLKYCAFAWGVPFIIVVVSLTLDLTGTVTLGYGSSDTVCYITDRVANTVVFGIPVALVLVFNLVSLIRVIAATRKNRQKPTSHSSRGSLVVAYLKLTILLGMTWILGFLASSGPGLSFLWCISEILNSLQGFFIALLFVATKNVLKMFRSRFHWCCDKNKSSSQQRITQESRRN